VAIVARSDDEWQRLAREMRRSDLADDVTLGTVEARRAREDELERAIAEWTATQHPEDVERRLQALGIPAHVSVSSRDFCQDPQLDHRGHLVTLEHPLHGSTTVEGPRYLLSETPGVVARAAPTFGQDNEYVLREILGYSAERYAELRDAGVLV
jgi:benzylsuccinate CoA-transferase BbsF subunit